MKKSNVSKKLVLRVIILALVFATVAAVIVYAKYISTVKDVNQTVKAKSFYFDSNYLTEHNTTYRLNT